MSTKTTSKKLNILMVAACPFPANHGSSASIREMSEELVKFGHTVHVITYPTQEDIPVIGVNIHRVNSPLVKPGAVKVGPTGNKFIYDPLMIIKSIGLIRKHKIDVIHAHNYEGAMIGWFGKFLCRKPMLYNAVNSMADELPSYNFIKPRWVAVWLGKLLDNIVPRSGDYVTVVSDLLKEFLHSKGLPANKVKVVPAGVNLEMFAAGDADKIRNRHQLHGAPVIMYTGAVEEFQRIDYLLQAMQVTVAKFPTAKLLLVGNIANATGRAKYRKMAQQLGIAEQTIFLDSVPLAELADYLAAADVAIVPRPECPGHPVKLLNYMAAAKAVVSFRGGAKGLHHMHNGYLAKDHDAQALGQGIVFLLENDDIRHILGAHAKQTISGTFDWETLARGIEAIYFAMLNGFTPEAHKLINQYIKDTYVFASTDRRAHMNRPHTCVRRSPDRRAQNLPIHFIERRKIGFHINKPAPPAAVAAPLDPAATHPTQEARQVANRQ